LDGKDRDLFLAINREAGRDGNQTLGQFLSDPDNSRHLQN